MAAHDIISQMRALRQRSLLHSWWHNSHRTHAPHSLPNSKTLILLDVFTALGVMLAFKSLDEQSKQAVRLPKGLDVDEIITHGNELLEQVGGEMHPIAARYLKSLQHMEGKLKIVTASREKALGARPLPPAPAPAPTDVHAKIEYESNSMTGIVNDDFSYLQQIGGDADMMFVEDFSEIESMFYTTGWFGQVDWSEMPQS